MSVPAPFEHRDHADLREQEIPSDRNDPDTGPEDHARQELAQDGRLTEAPDQLAEELGPDQRGGEGQEESRIEVLFQRALFGRPTLSRAGAACYPPPLRVGL